MSSTHSLGSEQSHTFGNVTWRNATPTTSIKPHSELKEAGILIAGALVLITAVLAAFIGAASLLAPLIPFKAEVWLANHVGSKMTRQTAGVKTQYKAPELREIERVFAKLQPHLKLPADMPITLHYLDSSTVNAFATVGGHVFIYRGLIDKLKSEDALAAVLAHEVGHVRERHVVRAITRGLAVSTALATLGIKSPGVSGVANQGSNLTMLYHSRGAEREADEVALDAVTAAYGHAGGVIELFEVFTQLQKDGPKRIEALQTHPLSDSRAQAMREGASKRGAKLSGAMTPLPPVLVRSTNTAPKPSSTATPSAQQQAVSKP